LSLSEGLEVLRCSSWRHIALSNSMFKSIVASQSTLRDLQLSLSVGSGSSNHFIPPFWQLRFPNLRSLEIGSWHSGLFDPPTVVTDFLLFNAVLLDNFAFEFHPSRETVRVAFTQIGGQLHLRNLTVTLTSLKDLLGDYESRIKPSLSQLDIQPGVDHYGIIGPFSSCVQELLEVTEFKDFFQQEKRKCLPLPRGALFRRGMVRRRVRSIS